MTEEAVQSGQNGGTSDDDVELHVEFDGRQITLRTDVSEMSDYLRRTFRAMLVPRVSESVGSFHLYRIAGGYALQGPEPLEFTGGIEALFDHLKHEVLFQFIRSRPDLLWLHSGAVERDGGAVLVSGPSGEGKSTLVTLLCERGWRFMSDDVAPISMDADEVLPYPQSPLRRVKARDQTPFIGIGTLEREQVVIPLDAIQRGVVPVRAIVFPVFQERTDAVLSRLSEGEAALELLRNCTSFAAQKSVAVDRASRIAHAVPAYRISYGAASDATRLIRSLK